MAAGINFGMNVTGFEIDNDYYNIAQKRVEDALQLKTNSLFQ
jgi:site-specific DNA-methyltransferase (adenine-specific)